MKKRIVNILLFLNILIFIGSCTKPEQQSNVFIQINNTKNSCKKITLTQVDSVPAFRNEILSYIKKNWSSRKGNKSDWFKVYSIRQGNKETAKTNRPIFFRSTCSTSFFRICQREDGMFVLEKKDHNDSIVKQASSSSGNWDMLKIMLKSPLNDSILKNILKNITSSPKKISI